MKTIIASKTGDRGFYDAGRVKDMSKKQYEKFRASYNKYVAEYDKRAAKGTMFQKKLTENQYLNEYAAIRSRYVSKGVDPGKRHIPEQIAKDQNFERNYTGDLHFYQELKQRGAIAPNMKFKEFRQLESGNFDDKIITGIEDILSDVNADKKKLGWSSLEIRDYVSKYYYGSE